MHFFVSTEFIILQERSKTNNFNCFRCKVAGDQIGFIQKKYKTLKKTIS